MGATLIQARPTGRFEDQSAMTGGSVLSNLRARIAARPGQALAVLAILAAAAVVMLAFKPRSDAGNGKMDTELSSQSKRERGVFHPSPAQWAGLSIQPVQQRVFHAELVTDGKIAVDEDHSTPIFSPYSGLIKRLAVKLGDRIQRGQLVFTLEATDMVQAQNDFITSLSALETARSQLKLAQIIEKRQHDLYDAKAVPLKDWQQAQNDLVAAQNGMRSAEIALEAVRNRLRILQKTEQEIMDFEKTGKINPETPIYAPIDGTIVQRKVGPGQYVISGASDPVFVVGDLSTVWLFANVREADAPKVAIGQAVEFKVLSYPERTFAAKISYVTPAIDPATRRVQVRANVENPGGLLQPEMFASVSIFTSDDTTSPAVPREAIIYEGNAARVWVAADDKSIELRRVRLGLTGGNVVQVLEGLAAGERVVTRGSLFIDRAATIDETF
jgi:cobalt-zinc-cadmium efflux system membrane fusion protein